MRNSSVDGGAKVTLIMVVAGALLLACASSGSSRSPSTAARGEARGATSGPSCAVLQAIHPATGSIFLPDSVDQPAVPFKDNPVPPVPGNMAEYDGSALEGRLVRTGTAQVDVAFVVDTLGCVETATVQQMGTADSNYVRSVIATLPRLRYQPALKDGKKVRAWLRWRFLFQSPVGARLP